VFPPVNLYDNGEAFLLRAELPGVNKDALELSVKGDELTLRGERKITPAQPNANYHRRECSGGQFRRVVTLPQPVNGEKISATFKNGVLEVVLPRVPEAQPRKITVH
jgi:HSP20 family protein